MLGYLKAKDRVGLEGHLVQFTALNGTDDRPGDGDVDPFAHAVFTARPARVHQPDRNLVLAQLLHEEVYINGMGSGKEGFAVKGAKDGFRFLDPPLGARHLGGVAHAVVIGGLLRREACHGGEDTKGIGRQEDNTGGVTSRSGGNGIGDGLDGEGGPAVLGVATIIVVDMSGQGIPGNVLHRRTVPLGGGIDEGLILGRQPDRFCVAAALEIVDPVLAPPVLVVAEEEAVRVHGQGGLAGTGEPEEDGDRALGGNVDRGVHGEDPLLRHQVVEDGEDGLLDLPGIARAANENQPAAEVEQDEVIGLEAQFPGRRLVEAEVGQADDVPSRLEFRQFRVRGQDEHVAYEQRLPGGCAHEPDRDAVARVGPREHILDIEVVGANILLDVFEHAIEGLLADGLVDVVPLNLVPGCPVSDDEAVLGRATGMTGPHREGQVVEQMPFTVFDGLLHQAGGWPAKAGDVRADAQITQVNGTQLESP